MNRTHAIGLLTLALCAAPGFCAETSNFTGLALGVTGALSHASIDYSGYIAGHSSSENDFAGGVTASYGLPLGETGVLGIGASYIVNSVKFGHTTYQEDGQTVDVSGKIKDHWSVFVAPGVKFAPQWLAYGKIAYHYATSDYTDTLVGSGTSKHHGFGYGAGIAYAVGRNLEINAEVGYVKLSETHFALSSGEPKITDFTVGLNYRF